MDALLAVVSAVERIGSCQNRSPSVQGGSDARLGNGDSLLFHDLVNSGPVILTHLVEFINAAHAHIGQHQGSGLQEHLFSDRVDVYSRSETDARAALASRVDAPGCYLGNVFEQLRFSYAGVSNQTNINLAPDSEVVLGYLGDSTNHEQQQGFLDNIEAKYLRGDGLSHFLEQVIISHVGPDRLYLEHLLLSHVHLHILFLLSGDLEHLQVGVKT